VKDLPREVKAQKARASFASPERGFCKHLRMRQSNLKPFIKSVRALASTLNVFDGSYYYEI
jgi:hypothetical protein